MPFAGRKTEMKKVKMSLETENILQETKVRHLSFMLPPEHKYHVTRVTEALRRTQGLTLPNGPLLKNFKSGTSYLTWRGRQNVSNARLEYYYHQLRKKPLVPFNETK